ncbi:hypothetical protein EGW08_011882 [Elysia chlorotica]|uniref:HTH myb-type domain-containing protein n=1 Tax=Elysia chlorotica TaxID=188477 RepID=A0A3S1BBS0_ELYCH|nr:hypothetical protein EGW08_011882 [Elysia chlorotica]
MTLRNTREVFEKAQLNLTIYGPSTMEDDTSDDPLTSDELEFVAAQDYFRLAGGVKDTAKVIETCTCPSPVLPAALFCLACAVKKNVSSQNLLLSGSFLRAVQRLLACQDEKIVDSAAFFLACVVADNGRGQQLIYETGCLRELLNILRRYLHEPHTDDSKWSIVTRAVAVCVNNPQNERNQGVCCSVLPLALKFISTEPQNSSIRHILAVITAVVSNNVSNQNRVRNCGGLEEIANLVKHQHRNHRDLRVSSIVYAVTALDACIADNVTSGIQAGEMEMISVILRVIQDFDLEPADLKTLLLAVAHILESHEKFSSHITEGRAYNQMVNLLTNSQDEELFKTIKYIFTLCKSKGRDFMEAINKKLEALSAQIEKKDDSTRVRTLQDNSRVTRRQRLHSQSPHRRKSRQHYDINSLQNREESENHHQYHRQDQGHNNEDMHITNLDTHEVCKGTGKDKIHCHSKRTFEITQDFNGSNSYSPHSLDQHLKEAQTTHGNSLDWQVSGTCGRGTPGSSTNHVQNLCYSDRRPRTVEAPTHGRDSQRYSERELDRQYLSLNYPSGNESLSSERCYHRENSGYRENPLGVTSETGLGHENIRYMHSSRAERDSVSSEQGKEPRSCQVPGYGNEPPTFQTPTQSGYDQGDFNNRISKNAFQNCNFNNHGEDQFGRPYSNRCAQSENANFNGDYWISNENKKLNGNGYTDQPIDPNCNVFTDRPSGSWNRRDCIDQSRISYMDHLGHHFNGNGFSDYSNGQLIGNGHSDSRSGQLNVSNCIDHRNQSFNDNSHSDPRNRNEAGMENIGHHSGNLHSYSNSFSNHNPENLMSNRTTVPPPECLPNDSRTNHTDEENADVPSNSSHNYKHITDRDPSNALNNQGSDKLNISCSGDYPCGSETEFDNKSFHNFEVLQKSQMDLLSHFQRVVNSIMSIIPGASDSGTRLRDSLSRPVTPLSLGLGENSPASPTGLISKRSDSLNQFFSSTHDLLDNIEVEDEGIAVPNTITTLDHSDSASDARADNSKVESRNHNNITRESKINSIPNSSKAKNGNIIEKTSELDLEKVCSVAETKVPDETVFAKPLAPMHKANTVTRGKSCTPNIRRAGTPRSFCSEGLMKPPTSSTPRKSHQHLSSQTTQSFSTPGRKNQHLSNQTTQSFSTPRRTNTHLSNQPTQSFSTPRRTNTHLSNQAQQSFSTPQKSNQHSFKQAPPSPALSSFDQKLQTIATSRQISLRTLPNTSFSSSCMPAASEDSHLVLDKNGIKPKQGSLMGSFDSDDEDDDEDDEEDDNTLYQSSTSDVDSTRSDSSNTHHKDNPAFELDLVTQGRINVPLDAHDQTGTLTPNHRDASPSQQYDEDGCHFQSAKSLQGCAATQSLNSRTFNIAIETSRYTCRYHSTLRQLEREEIKQQIKQIRLSESRTLPNLRDCSLSPVTSKTNVYHFSSESDTDKYPSSPGKDVSIRSVQKALEKKTHKKARQSEARRPRVPYSDQELANLREGVRVMGRRWQQILCTYQFHPSRTSVDLKDKYRGLTTSQRNHTKPQCPALPFSMCEVRRLKRGVKMFGYNWKAILNCSKFLPGRTARDLRDKWKALNKSAGNQLSPQDI